MELLTYPSEQLRGPCMAVEKITPWVRKNLDEMMQKMDEWNGIGLAAPQCGVPLNMFVLNIPNFGRHSFINPVVESLGDDSSSIEEGCLSLPDVLVKVIRPSNIRVRALDYNGNMINECYSGLMSTCIQHETDHLSRILIIDKIDSYDRRVAVQNLWDRKNPRIKATAAGR